MADMEKVIKGLECCTGLGCHHGCKYLKNGCTQFLKMDALELLKEQEQLKIALSEGQKQVQGLLSSGRELEETINILKGEIDRLKAEKTKAFDYLFSKFAGHSNYHGDSVLCAIEAVKEGKKIETVKTMDEDGEQEIIRYKCSKPFSVPRCDADGGLCENNVLHIKENSIWDEDDSCNILGGDIHLVNAATGEWIEIDMETLEENFIK